VCFAGTDRLASASETDSIHIWNFATGRLVQTLQGHRNKVRCVAYLGKNELLSGSFDNTLRIWDLKTFRCKLEMRHGGDVKCVCKVGSELVASGGLDNSIKIWHRRKGQCMQTLTGHRHCVQSVCDLRNSLIASSSTDHDVKIWDVDLGRCVATLQGHSRTVWSVCPVGGTLLASAGMDKLIKLWDYDQQICIKTIDDHEDSVFTICKIGEYLLASGSQDSTIKLWDVRTFQCIDTLVGHDKGISCITKIPGTSMIASGSFDSNMNLWKIEELDHAEEELGEDEYDLGEKAIATNPHNHILPPVAIPKRDYTELIKKLLEDHSYNLEHIEFEIDDKRLTDQNLLLKRDFLRAVKERDQTQCLSMINNYNSSAPILYMFQSYLDHALNKEMALFKNKFNQMRTPKQSGCILDPYDYNKKIVQFQQLWNDRNDSTELLMILWSRCSGIHVSKMTALTTEFDKKTADFKNFEIRREKLVREDKPNCASRLNRLKMEIKQLKMDLESKERLLDAEYINQIQIQDNIQKADTSLKSLDHRKLEIQGILEQHRSHSADMSKLTEEINVWRKNMHSHLISFQARLVDVKRKFELGWKAWEPKHIINWMCSLDSKFEKYRLTLQTTLPNHLSKGVDLQYINVTHLHQIGIQALRDRVAIHKEIQRLIHLDLEGETHRPMGTTDERRWRTWTPKETVDWICSLDSTFDTKYRRILVGTIPEQIIKGDDLRYLDVDLLIGLGVQQLTDRGKVMQNVQRLMKLRRSSRSGGTTFE